MRLPSGFNTDENLETEYRDERGAYLPTPHQIEAAAANIQQDWTARERRKRYVGDPGDQEWRVPVVRSSFRQQ